MGHNTNFAKLALRAGVPDKANTPLYKASTPLLECMPDEELMN
jgi:hypothetical protein